MRTDVEGKNGEVGGVNWEERSHTGLAEQDQAEWPQQTKDEQNRHKLIVGV